MQLINPIRRHQLLRCVRGFRRKRNDVVDDGLHPNDAGVEAAGPARVTDASHSLELSPRRSLNSSGDVPMAADESSSGSPVRLKLIALGVGAVAGLGCALVFMLTQGHHAAATVRAVPSVQFAYVEHAPMVGNDETPESVVAFEKTRYDARIAPNSSGTLTSRPIGTPYFNSATDERHWRTLQRPVERPKRQTSSTTL